MMLVVFLGPPGSGKGTQAELLSRRFQLPSLSTGEMLRAAKESGSELGNSIQKQLDSGLLIDDETVIQLVVDCLNDPKCESGALLDGFPRTLAQALSLDEYLEGLNRSLDRVIQLRVPEPDLRSRLSERYLKLDRPRPEDRPEFIPKRLEIYEKITRPLVDYYSQRSLLAEIDGLGTEEEVFDRILECFPGGDSPSGLGKVAK
ncbi:MAG: adenylate kinase [Planctomycetota bacterium]|nr:adenylate kinase [Planctomycetota bacterium]